MSFYCAGRVRKVWCRTRRGGEQHLWLMCFVTVAVIYSGDDHMFKIAFLLNPLWLDNVKM